MSTAFADIEKLAFSLPENLRAKLADSLFRSLPDDFIDEDEITEAVRRDREMDVNPEMIMSLEELDRRMAERLGR
jgi:hypothetical protein